MMARSKRSNERPDTVMQDRINQVDETSCTARPDHTVGSKAVLLPCQLKCPVCPKADTGAYSPRQLLANAAIAFSRVGSYPCAARR
jgi:hypothetical protein